MDVSQPLCIYQDIRGRNGKLFCITLSYERPPFFCFLCGTMGHSEKECVNVEDDEPERSMGWGKYLRATPRRGVQKFLDEVEEVTSCRKNLFVAKSKRTKGEGREDNENQEKGEGVWEMSTGLGNVGMKVRTKSPVEHKEGYEKGKSGRGSSALNKNETKAEGAKVNEEKAAYVVEELESVKGPSECLVG